MQLISTPEARTEFLLEMYRQTSNHLNRHILLVWQSVALLGGAYAAFAFQEKAVISVHVACSIAITLCAWFCANVYDAHSWFDRNLTIISNIERLFLTHEDTKLVHPFFPTHRAAGDLLMHFKIQLTLGLGIAVITTTYHFLTQVQPSFKIPGGVFNFELAMPYFCLLIGGGLCVVVRHHGVEAARSLRSKAPGHTVTP